MLLHVELQLVLLALHHVAACTHTCCKVFPREPTLTPVLEDSLDLLASDMALAACSKAHTVTLEYAVKKGVVFRLIRSSEVKQFCLYHQPGSVVVCMHYQED